MGSGVGEVVVSGGSSGKVGSGEWHCDKRDSRVYTFGWWGGRGILGSRGNIRKMMDVGSHSDCKSSGGRGIRGGLRFSWDM